MLISRLPQLEQGYSLDLDSIIFLAMARAIGEGSNFKRRRLVLVAAQPKTIATTEVSVSFPATAEAG